MLSYKTRALCLTEVRRSTKHLKMAGLSAWSSVVVLSCDYKDGLSQWCSEERTPKRRSVLG
jgi:peroxiredoxin